MGLATRTKFTLTIQATVPQFALGLVRTFTADPGRLLKLLQERAPMGIDVNSVTVKEEQL